MSLSLHGPMVKFDCQDNSYKKKIRKTTNRKTDAKGKQTKRAKNANIKQIYKQADRQTDYKESLKLFKRTVKQSDIQSKDRAKTDRSPN